MGPHEQKLRAALRQEANAVQIPQDMWANISQRLEPAPHSGAAARSGMRARRDWWRGGFALAVAAGVFWLSVLPTGHQADRSFSAPRGVQGRPAVLAQAADSDLLAEPRSIPVERPASQSRHTAWNRFAAQDAKPRFNLPLQ